MINPQDIIIFTSQTTKRNETKKQFEFLDTFTKEQFDNKTLVIVCTYSMLSYSGVRREEGASEKMMRFIREHDWGLMLLDEV